ncbi:MAG: MAPEG family protein [Pseudoxanthomonas sp.]
MSPELKMLAWSILLGLVHVLLAAALSTAQRGLGWNASNRDGETAALTGVAGRADRARHNFLETFPFFAAAVLAVVALEAGNTQTALGAQVYFWARLAYLPVYLIGVRYLRSAIWVASLWGLLQLVWALV